MGTKFATRLRRRQRNQKKILNIFALLGALLLPVYPAAFGNYVQDYTGSIVRGNYDSSTIISTYDASTGRDILADVLDEPEANSDGSIDVAESIPDPSIVVLPPIESLPQDDPKTILYPIHTVTPKQTLDGISKQFDVSIEDMKKANPGLDSDLKIDQKITIPKINGVEYTVKQGDVLSVIAAKYGINNMYHILLANNLANASKIRVGQKLFLPNPTKDPTPKKPELKPSPTPVTPTKNNTSPTPSVKPAPKPPVSIPSTLAYGTYSLQLQVSNGCRNFAWGNCTCFVAKYKKVTWRGNAKQWLRNAQAQGVPTGNDPKPGAIVVYDGPGYSPYYGHVGIVMEVGEEHIIVKDMNYSALNQITTRRESFKNNKAIKGYIYAD